MGDYTKPFREYQTAANEFQKAIYKAKSLERARKAEEERKALAEKNYLMRTLSKEYEEVGKWKSYIRSMEGSLTSYKRTVSRYEGYVKSGYARYEKPLAYYKKLQTDLEAKMESIK